jgi:hypothetical protein
VRINILDLAVEYEACSRTLCVELRAVGTRLAKMLSGTGAQLPTLERVAPIDFRVETSHGTSPGATGYFPVLATRRSNTRTPIAFDSDPLAVPSRKRKRPDAPAVHLGPPQVLSQKRNGDDGETFEANRRLFVASTRWRVEEDRSTAKIRLIIFPERRRNANVLTRDGTYEVVQSGDKWYVTVSGPYLRIRKFLRAEFRRLADATLGRGQYELRMPSAQRGPSGDTLTATPPPEPARPPPAE